MSRKIKEDVSRSVYKLSKDWMIEKDEQEMNVEGSGSNIIFYALWVGRRKDIKLETLGAPGEIQNWYSPNTGSNRVALLGKQCFTLELESCLY
jgi:hypothetical protein